MLELCRCPNIYGPDCIYIYFYGMNMLEKHSVLTQVALVPWHMSLQKPILDCQLLYLTCHKSLRWDATFSLKKLMTECHLLQVSEDFIWAFYDKEFHSVLPEYCAKGLKSKFLDFFSFSHLMIGDFFKDDLPKAELYILARILHDWSDEKLHVLLSKLSKMCTPGKCFKKWHY